LSDARPVDPRTSEIVSEWFFPRLFPVASRTVEEFACQEVVIPKGPLRGTLYDPSFMPFFRFVFEAMENKYYRKMAIVGPTQAGKSLVCNNIPMLYTLFELQEDIIVGIPTMDLAKGIWSEKIRPVIAATRYESLLPTSGAGARGGVPQAIELKNGVFLRFMPAGGGDGQRSSHTARVVIITEVDKMDDIGESSEESDPVSQIEMRADAFADTSKIILECTTTTEAGRIWQEAMVIGTGSRAWVPCPECGRYQPLVQKGLCFDPNDSVTAEESARYRCEHCEAMLDDSQRREMLKSPRLVHKTQSIDEHGNLVGDQPKTRVFGFHYNVLYSPMQSLGKTAAQQWEADAADLREKKKAMVQSKWAMPWSEDQSDGLRLSFHFLKQRAKISETRLRTVPNWCDFLIFEVDVQKHVLYWHAEAYRRDGTSQVVEYGITDIVDESDRAIVKALDMTHEITQEGWPVIDNPETVVQPRLCLLDTGYRYDVIAPWLRARTGWFGVKGTGRGSKVKITGAKAIFSIPGIVTVRPQDDGNKIWFVDVDSTKAIAHDRYFLGASQPGYTEVPGDVTQGYLMSITAEQRKFSEAAEGFVWEKIRRRNDYLDCRSYGVAGAMYLAMRTKRDEQVVAAKAEANKEKVAPVVEPVRKRSPIQTGHPSFLGRGVGDWFGSSGRVMS